MLRLVRFFTTQTLCMNIKALRIRLYMLCIIQAYLVEIFGAKIQLKQQKSGGIFIVAIFFQLICNMKVLETEHMTLSLESFVHTFNVPQLSFLNNLIVLLQK